MSNLFKYLYFTIILLSVLNDCSSAAEDAYGLKEIFDGCSFQGRESIRNDNVNCTKLPIPQLWDENANNRCVKEYVKGCQLAKMEHFCQLGVSDHLKYSNQKCEPLKREYELAMDFYVLCCNVCAKGKASYLNKQSCKPDVPLNAGMPEIIIQNQFEYCCSSKTTKGLRSLSDFEQEDDYFDTEDVDICTKFGCDHFCREIDFNKAECSCRKGFELNRDRRKCDDIDECALRLNDCLPNVQACTNLPGTFECKELVLNSTDPTNNETKKLFLRNKLDAEEDEAQCKNGSYFDPHRNKCIDITDKYETFCLDEKCDTKTKELIAQSVTSVRCKDGLFDLDKGSCVVDKPDSNQQLDKSKNETSSSYTNNSQLMSRDSLGMPQEECDDGQKRNANGSCIEFNACVENSTICGSNAKCTSSFGKVRCDCLDGFEKINETSTQCEDKDECLTGNNDCLKSASTCENSIGSYECICKSGYEKPHSNSSKACVNIDECSKKELNNCHHKCYDSLGSYECTCKDGYKLNDDNKTCTEIDQCYSNEYCSGICEKKGEGNYTCTRCETGFKVDKEKERCISIDECKPGFCPDADTCIHLKNGTSVCVNLKCPLDYEFDTNDKLCILKEGVKNKQSPLSLTKLVLVLPIAYLNQTRTIHRLKQPEEMDSVEFKYEISNQTDGEYAVNKTYFKLLDQKKTFNLLIEKPVKEKQSFIIELNAIYKKKILHKSELFVFIV